MGSVMDGSASSTIHIYLNNHPIKDVPTEEDAMSKWLLERWVEKDAMMGKFKENPKSLGQPLTPELNRIPSVAPFFGLFATFLSFAAPVLYAVSRFPNGIRYFLLGNTAFSLAVLIFIAVNLRPSKKGKTKKGSINPAIVPVTSTVTSTTSVGDEDVVVVDEKEKDV